MKAVVNLIKVMHISTVVVTNLLYSVFIVINYYSDLFRPSWWTSLGSWQVYPLLQLTCQLIWERFCTSMSNYS